MLVEHEGKLLLATEKDEQLELEFTCRRLHHVPNTRRQHNDEDFLGVDGLNVPTAADAKKHKRWAAAKTRRRKTRDDPSAALSCMSCDQVARRPQRDMHMRCQRTPAHAV